MKAVLGVTCEVVGNLLLRAYESVCAQLVWEFRDDSRTKGERRAIESPSGLPFGQVENFEPILRRSLSIEDENDSRQRYSGRNRRNLSCFELVWLPYGQDEPASFVIFEPEA
jgi:hypothetical protein